MIMDVIYYIQAEKMHDPRTLKIRDSHCHHKDERTQYELVNVPKDGRIVKIIKGIPEFQSQRLKV